MLRTFSTFINLALAVLFLASCGGGSNPPANPPAPIATIKGFVVADDPIVGATISVTGKDGKDVAGAATTSNQHGAFLIALDGLPQTYTVTAKGGTFRDKPFNGSMKVALSPSFNPRTTVVYLTPVTTLAAAYGGTASGETEKQVEAKVKTFLSLPSHVTISKYKRHAADDFSAVSFMSQATSFQGSEGKGFDPYVASLAREIGSGTPRTYAASRLRELAAAEAEEANLAVQLLTWALKNVAGGAVGAVGAKVFSTVLGAAGAGGTDLSEVQGKLDEISTQITALSDQLSTLQSTLGCDITNYGYNDLVGGDVQSKLDLVGSVQSMMDHLSKMSVTDSGYASEQSDIRINTQANLAIHTDVYHFIAGNAALGTMGAVKGLGGKLTSCGYFFNAAKSDLVAKQYAYLAHVLVGACQMVVAYHNDRNETADATTKSAACNNTYTPNVVALVTPNSIPIDSNVVIDTRYNLMWWNFGLKQPDPRLSSGSIHEANFGPALDTALWTTGKVWSVPAVGDVGSFITPCYGKNANSVKNCLAEKGWGTFNETTRTYTSFYGDGSIFFWLANYERMPRGAVQGGYGGKIMNFTGASDWADCSSCYAAMMIVRELEPSEIYWRK